MTRLSDNQISVSHLCLKGTLIDGEIAYLAFLNNRNNDLNANATLFCQFLCALAENPEEEDLFLEIKLADEEAESREGLAEISVLMEIVEEGTEVTLKDILLARCLLHVGKIGRAHV